MIKLGILSKQKRLQKGETLVGLLIATAIGSIILVATASSFSSSMRALWDRITISEANNQAREIARIIASDLRMIGSGMPLGTAKFDMLDVTLGNAPMPILIESNLSRILFRLNETGKFTSSTRAFDPFSESNISVLSTNDFSSGKTVYISNITSEFSQSSTQGGLRAKISSIGTSTISLKDIVAGSGVNMNPGSIVEPVSDITIDCNGTGGITRDDGNGALVLFPKSTCSFEYLDASGTNLSMPLNSSTIQSILSSIRFTVNVPGRRVLRNGSTYTAQTDETVTLRNLILARNS